MLVTDIIDILTQAARAGENSSYLSGLFEIQPKYDIMDSRA